MDGSSYQLPVTNYKMPLDSTITNALIMPGVSTAKSGWSLLVGLVIDDQQIAWGQCRFDQPQSEPTFGLDDGLHLLQERIIPLLIGQPLSSVRHLMAQLDEMVRQVTVVRPITAETPPLKRSRRELFNSLVNPSAEIQEVVERPLPPELRQGVSQALVSAVALTEDKLVIEVVAELYSLNRANSLLPVHLLFDELPNPNDPVLVRIMAASYGLRVGDGDVLKTLGNNGVRLQNRVRQLKNRVVGHVENGPGPVSQPVSFLFDLKGGYGRLYEGNSGRMLGAISGLEQTVKGCGLRLVDPMIMDSWQEQLDSLKELQNFVRLRKMETTLLARAGVDSAEAIHALADNACCGGVVLDMTRLGTLHRTIVLAQAAKARGLEVVLMGVKGETAVQVALALNPTLLAVGVEDVSAVADEMNRTIAWLGYSLS